METLVSGEAMPGEAGGANPCWIIQLAFPSPHPCVVNRLMATPPASMTCG